MYQPADVLAVLEPLAQYSHQCHEASIVLVRSGVLGPSRVARGWCTGIRGQHSWVVLGMDCYDDDAQIVDPTLWSYDEAVEGIWEGSYTDGKHRPHGKGNIFAWGRPLPAVAPALELTPSEPWSNEARLFLKLLGPLDFEGWLSLTKAPVEGWPAGEIFAAMEDTRDLEGRVPIDILGMTTMRNPGQLYLPSSY